MARRTLSNPGRDGRRKVLTGGNSFGMELDLSAVNDMLSALESGVEAAIRPMAQAGAQVIYERVRLNVQGLGRVTGNLDRSIYQYFSDEKSEDGKRAEYHISWNHKKAPHGHLVEFGYLQRYRYY